MLVKDWNTEQKKMNGRGIEARSINDNLELIKSQIRQKYRDLQKEPNVITALSVKTAYLNKQKQLKEKKWRISCPTIRHIGNQN